MSLGTARHQLLNVKFWHSLKSAYIPPVEEPSGLSRQDGNGRVV